MSDLEKFIVYLKDYRDRIRNPGMDLRRAEVEQLIAAAQRIVDGKL